MAKAPSKKDSSATVTRIKASESAAPKPVKAKPAIDTKRRETAAKQAKREQRSKHNPLHPIAAYFKGSWYELTQVRWPDRRSTWGMTGALIAFTLFFVVVILVCDYAFAQLFKLILGSN